MRRYYQTIQLAKRHECYTRHGLHFELLFRLYGSLGHGRKAEIVSLFEAGDLDGRVGGPREQAPSPETLHPELGHLLSILAAASSPQAFGGYPLVSVSGRGGAAGGRVELLLSDGDRQVVLSVVRADECSRPILMVQRFAIERHWSLPVDNRERMKAVQELAQVLNRVAAGLAS